MKRSPGECDAHLMILITNSGRPRLELFCRSPIRQLHISYISYISCQIYYTKRSNSVVASARGCPSKLRDASCGTGREGLGQPGWLVGAGPTAAGVGAGVG